MTGTRETPELGSPNLLDVRCVYQPIVELDSGHVVGYEALARWPSIPDAAPEQMFDCARVHGRLDELEWACRLAAIRGALAADMQQGFTLFVNVEADTTPGSQPETAADVIVEASNELRVTIEITERALLTDPGLLLATMSTVRQLGYGVALDDVGSNPDSLTIMEFVAPDIVKLDRRLVQHPPTRDEAKILTAVSAYAERTPTTILAEGIETERDLEQARSLGATLGQGWLLGRPSPLGSLPTPSANTTAAVPFHHSAPNELDPLWSPKVPSSLFGRIPPRVATEPMLTALARSIEDHALSLSEPLSVIASFQHVSHFTAKTADRFALLAEANPLVAVLGAEMPPGPAAGVRGVSFGTDDPLRDEWVLAVVGRHYFAAIVAREIARADTRDSGDRRFDYVLTYDPSAVLAVARSLASRLSRFEGIIPESVKDVNETR